MKKQAAKDEALKEKARANIIEKLKKEREEDQALFTDLVTKALDDAVDKVNAGMKGEDAPEKSD